MAAATLLPRTTCPHCWHSFAPEEVLWIAEHRDLRGDPWFADDQPLRFLPSRFHPDGNALDPHGEICHHLACPHCHLGVPRELLELGPVFVSVFGATSSGKSFYLAAAARELRRLLPEQFALGFADDVDTVASLTLNDYEAQLFRHPQPDAWVPLGDLIRKTQMLGDDLYDVVLLGGDRPARYPRPFQFAIRPLPRHTRFAEAARAARVLCLYDNAGESFRPGEDRADSPVTRHLAEAAVLLFLFDPADDPPFRQKMAANGLPVPPGGGSAQQTTVLREAAARLRRLTHLGATARPDRPFIVVVTKSDLWGPLLQDEADGWPPWALAPRDGLAGIDGERIERRSRAVRELLLRTTPEVVYAAEDVAPNVLFLDVSALGTRPEPQGPNGLWAVRPRDVQPINVAVPLLYGLYRGLPGLVPGLRRRAGQGA